MKPLSMEGVEKLSVSEPTIVFPSADTPEASAELQRENDAHRAALTAVPSGWVAGANAMQRATKEAHDDRDSEIARREAELAAREAEVHAMRVLIEDHLPTEPPLGPPPLGPQ